MWLLDKRACYSIADDEMTDDFNFDAPMCEYCRASLINYPQYEEYWGKPVKTDNWECPNCDES